MEPLETLARLTARESDVLELMEHGLTNRELADALDISERTARFHISNIFAKLDVSNRTEAVAWAVRARGTPAPDSGDALDARGDTRRPYQLPRAPTYFVGRRDALASIVEALSLAGTAVFAIEGMGGVGKTALATLAAERLRDAYPDGQLWIDLGGTSSPLSPSGAMTHVLASLGARADAVESEVSLVARYRSELEGRRVLIVLDDAADARQFEALLPPSGCALLVTSRRRLGLAGARAIALLPLGRRESEDLLERLAPSVGTSAARLAEACGDLPLALHLAARALAEAPHLDPEEYAQLLTGADPRAKVPVAGAFTADVDACLALSFDRLDARSQRSLALLGVLQGRFDRRAAEAILDACAEDALEVIGALVRLNLVLWVGGRGSSAQYRLHDLVRAFARRRLDESSLHAARLRHGVHYLGYVPTLCDQFCQGAEGQDQSVRSVLLSWPEVGAAFDWCEAHIDDEPRAAEMCRVVFQKGARLLWQVLPATDRVRWAEAALRAAARSGEPSPALLLSAGIAYMDVHDRVRARDCYQRAYEAARRVGNLQVAVGGLINLGILHKQVGEPAAALELYEEARAMFEAASPDLDVRRPEGAQNAAIRARHLQNSANCMLWLGRFGRARDMYERSAVLARAAGDLLLELACRALVVSAWHMLGDDHVALHAAEEALAIAEKLGTPHASGILLREQSRALSGLGRLHEAWSSCERALSAARSVADPTEIVFAEEVEALLMLEMGDVRSARAAALAVARTSADLGLPDVGIGARVNVALADRELGALGSAAEALDEAADAAKARSVFATAAEICFDLAATHRELGDLGAAADAIQRGVALTRDLGCSFGEARVHAERGALHLALGAVASSREAHTEQLAVARRLRSPRAEAIAEAALGAVLRAEGRPREAVELLERSVAFFMSAPLPCIGARASAELGYAYLDLGARDRAHAALAVRVAHERRIAHQDLAAHEAELAELAPKSG